MDNLEALREAIAIIRNGIDDDSLIADHGYAQEIISQLEQLLADSATQGGRYGRP